MRPRHLGPIVAAALLAAACSSQDTRQWMKVGGASYTREEFNRDVAACTRDGKLDDPCMQGRGWIAVTADKSEKIDMTDPRNVRPGRSGGR